VTRADEYRPSPELVGQALVEVVCPVVKGLQRELKLDLTCAVVVLAGGVPGPIVELSCGKVRKAAGARTAPDREARITFRHAFPGNRKIFFVEAIYRDIKHPSGFSGFHVKGEVRLLNEGATMKSLGYTIRYNDFEWKDWI